MQGLGKFVFIAWRTIVRHNLPGALLIFSASGLAAATASNVPQYKPQDSLMADSLQPASASQPGSPFSGNVAEGQALFTGQRKFQNGGPACGSCHSIATLAFPGGGAMAPDLTHEYSKLGPEGMHYTLRTLYFPAMNALFLKHQLTDQEESDLSALFQSADHATGSSSGTSALGGFGALGLLVLFGITWVSGRGRVHSVRRRLLKRAGLYREDR